MERVKFTDKSGQNRIGVKLICPICNKQYISRIDKQLKFCSRKCYGYSNQKRVLLVCSYCRKEFYRTLSKLKNAKHEIFFCCRQCKDIGQKTIKEIQPAHYGTADKTKKYREKFIKQNRLICTRCGYKEFTCSVQIHHIDKDRNNDNIDNLVSLCANCHLALHFNKWKL
jgi:endogenous inhibitor of DNA gyrase (YacG/DUF329 family)